MVFNIVVFPDALLPKKTTSSPGFISAFTPWRTFTEPYDEWTSLSSRMGPASGSKSSRSLKHLPPSARELQHNDERLSPESLASLASSCLPPVPRYACITSGFATTSLGVPSAIFSPWSSTIALSHAPAITSILCSITSTVYPCSLRTQIPRTTSSASSGVIPAVGSSRSRMRGVSANPLASSTLRLSG